MKVIVVYSGGRLVAPDPKNAPNLYREGFYGRPLGIVKPKDLKFEAPVQLSFYEALYLIEKGKIKVIDIHGKELSYDDLLRNARRYYKDFDLIYKVYKDLRERGYVVRPGMKFGSTFAVYEYGPGIDHAPFLVEVMKWEDIYSPLDIVRAGRLTHTVRKKLLLATVNPIDNKVRYYIFKWLRL